MSHLTITYTAHIGMLVDDGVRLHCISGLNVVMIFRANDFSIFSFHVFIAWILCIYNLTKAQNKEKFNRKLSLLN